MKLLALPIGNEDTASSWYRFYQFLPRLRASGWEVEILVGAADASRVAEQAAGADIVLNQKNLLRGNLARALRHCAKRVVFDFDDAVFTRPGKPFSWLTQLRVNARLRYQLRTADLVTVSSRYLADYAVKYATRVEVLPMAIDLNVWTERPAPRSETVTIGWSGAPHNLGYLEQLEPVLARLVAEYPRVRLAVFCGRAPRWSLPVQHVPFAKGEDHRFVAQLDIGLLPLGEDSFTRGKSPIKVLQYMACGVPVVGNVFGATSEILVESNSIAVHSPEQWHAALAALVADPQRRAALGRAGRSFVAEHHDANVAYTRLSAALAGRYQRSV
jgi:glycosyltransferase involved in cell wall biosynthesis